MARAVLSQSWREETDVATAGTVAARPLRILVAEDSPLNQKLALSLLRKHGHIVTLANNGKEAVNAVTSRSFAPLPVRLTVMLCLLLRVPLLPSWLVPR